MAYSTNLNKRVARSRQERGAVLVLTALVMLLLLFIAAFATDLGAWYRQGQEQQRAADVGALNGIQAYDRGVKGIFEANGVNSWSELEALNPDLLVVAEAAGMREAVDTVIGLLEASGLQFTDSGTGTIATDPTNPADSSTWTVIATDRTIVTITRTFEPVEDFAGNITQVRSISVDVQAPGEQYFSNLLRDAPEITRAAQSTLSNCGADCSVDIPIEPPFRGFDATGNGDGWAPLLRGDSEIWAVNHHSNNKTGAPVGSIICMDRTTETFCDFSYPGGAGKGLVPLTTFRTHTRPTDLIDNDRDKIFFTAARQPGGTSNRVTPTESGLACFDMAARDWCSTQFTALWPQTVRNDTNAVGPMLYDGKLYIVAHDGELACVDPDTMAECGRWELPSAAHPNIPAIDSRGKTNNIELVGSKLLISLNLANGHTAFDCVDLAASPSPSPCWSTLRSTSTPANGVRRFTYLSMSPSGVPTGICTVHTSGGNACADINTGVISDQPALGTFLDNNLGDDWIGDSFAVVSGGEVRTFFGGGKDDITLCWDWKAGSDCGIHVHDGLVQPYAFAQVTEDCVIGLGDRAVFFTLTVDTLETCTGSSVSTTITPCTCADGSLRYGALDLPIELKNVLDTAHATITGGGLTITGDLLAGPLDLSQFNGLAPTLDLVIVADSKVVGGTVQWTESYSANLSLVVQPTLTN